MCARFFHRKELIIDTTRLLLNLYPILRKIHFKCEHSQLYLFEPGGDKNYQPVLEIIVRKALQIKSKLIPLKTNCRKQLFNRETINKVNSQK